MTASDPGCSVTDSVRRVVSASRAGLSAYTTLEMPPKRGCKRFDARTKSSGQGFERLRIHGFPLWHIRTMASVRRLEVHCVFLVLSSRRVSFCHVKVLIHAKALMTAKSLPRCSELCIKEVIQRAFFYWHAFVQVSDRKTWSAYIRTRVMRGY